MTSEQIMSFRYALSAVYGEGIFEMRDEEVVELLDEIRRRTDRWPREDFDWDLWVEEEEE